MALLWAESFEYYGSDELNMLDGNWSSINHDYSTLPVKLSTDEARTGIWSLHFQGGVVNGPRRAFRSLGGQQQTVGCGFGIYWPAVMSGNSMSLALVTAIGYHIVTLQFTGGIIRVWAGNQVASPSGQHSVLLGETPVIYGAAAWNHIEFRVDVSSTDGRIEIRANGVTEFLLTNLDLGSVLPSQIFWGSRQGGNANQVWNFFIDDIVVWNAQGDYVNDFIGPARVTTVYPVADTSVNDWTVEGATDAFDAVNETDPDDDTTYLNSEDIGDRVELLMDVLPPEIENIEAIFVPARARSTEPGIANIQLSMIDGSAVEVGPSPPLTVAYTYRPSTFYRNPTTGNKWTRAEFEAATLRIEKSG